MNVHPTTTQDSILGGLWGCVVGDALGVPVEFQSRSTIRKNPVTDLRAFGTHNQPQGTWSDDSSLMLCTMESLFSNPLDPEDMARRFVGWHDKGDWTPWGKVFDIGIATSRALSAFSMGAAAEEAGGRDLYSNGNGSLMRQLPVTLLHAADPLEEFISCLHRVSSITHGHPRSLMACGFHGLVVRALLEGTGPADAYEQAVREFDAHYHRLGMDSEKLAFTHLLKGQLAGTDPSEIRSGGYVMETLTASIWCLLTTSSFEDCVFKAVNLGDDADTTGCVAGGLAGVCYGLSSVPKRWREKMARAPDIEVIFNQFTAIVLQSRSI